MRFVLVMMIGLSSCVESPLSLDRRNSADEDRSRERSQRPEGNQGPQSDIQARKPHTIMVMDVGITTSHPVFDNKVVAKYTYTCRESGSAGMTSYQQYKQYLLNELDNSRCSLKEGIEFRESPEFQNIASQREAWNQVIRSKSPRQNYPGFQEIYETISGQDIDHTYHGTSTAGLVAYQNPNLKMVLVEADFIKSGSDDSVNCLRPELMNWIVQANQDPEIIQAYGSRLSSIDKAFLEMAKRHQVTVANFSFGAASRVTQETAYATRRPPCAVRDLRDYYRTSSEFETKTEKMRYDSGLYDYKYVSVLAAGNDGVQIDDGEDSLECENLEQHTLLVGSLDANGRVSEFSNSGRCVSMYTLGRDVVVPVPAGFLNISSGTSFAAPLTVRYISQTIDAGLGPDGIVAELLKRRESNGYLPYDSFPRELANNLNEGFISTYALTAGEVQHIAEPMPMPIGRRSKTGMGVR